MNLTKRTDLAIRMLVFFADRAEEGATSREVAAAHNISASHCAKIMHQLSAREWLETSPGRGSRATLAVDPAALSIGEVVQALEPFELVECFNAERDSCLLSGHCKLKGMLREAKRAFVETLQSATVADLQTEHSRLLAKIS